jgi:hypothetical protein
MNDKVERTYAERMALLRKHYPAALASARRMLKYDGEVTARWDQKNGEIKLHASGLWELTIRIRGPEFFHTKWRHDITFRTTGASAKKVEFARVKEGEGNLMMVCFAMPEGDGVQGETIIDLEKFREGLDKDLIVESDRRMNTDGTGFVAFDIRLLGNVNLDDVNLGIVVATKHPWVRSVYGDLAKKELEDAQRIERKKPKQASLFDQEEEAS